MLERGKPEVARRLTEKNLAMIEEAIAKSPEDAYLRLLEGYTLRDLYQTTRGFRSQEKRERHLVEAKRVFAALPEADPNDTGALDGLGNVLFFEGRIDESIATDQKALAVSDAACRRVIEHDLNLSERYRRGEIRPGVV